MGEGFLAFIKSSSRSIALGQSSQRTETFMKVVSGLWSVTLQGHRVVRTKGSVREGTVIYLR